MTYHAGRFDIIVIGAGHAGVEAALASARLGYSTLLLAIQLDSVAYLACNPAIGGTAKGHLVREVDALGGEMAINADATLIQGRMLNTAKGPAVHSLRAQADKRAYAHRMKRTLEHQKNLVLRQAEAVRLHTENGRICGVETATGALFSCRSAIVASGVYLKSRIFIGDWYADAGPSGFMPANGLSASLTELSFSLRRFKTGTPCRVSRSSMDLSKMVPQYGDEPIVPFSFLTASIIREQIPCYMAYTNAETKRIILENIHRSPLYGGKISGTGARYCPSIEDKMVRFADKERHQLFLEPEGADTDELYVQGMSSSLPEDVQIAMLRTIEGMEKVEVMRCGYAIEYDCIDPQALHLNLESRAVRGLFFAGQVNGTSGYEEAAAQGVLAGLNAVQYLRGEEPLIVGRDEGYCGVLVDDLVTRGTNEPYRMMTARAEFRLLLRQDNADMRLTEKGRALGLVNDDRYDAFCRRRDAIEKAIRHVSDTIYPPQAALQSFLAARGETPPAQGIRACDLLRRTGVTYESLREVDPALPELPHDTTQTVETTVKYEGYIARQQAQVEKMRQLENQTLPTSLVYADIDTLRIEARQKLDAVKPANLGQAARISGVSPADIAVLMIYLQKMQSSEKEART